MAISAALEEPLLESNPDEENSLSGGFNAIFGLDNLNLGLHHLARRSAEPFFLSMFRNLNRRPASGERPHHRHHDFLDGIFNHHGDHGHGGKRSAEPFNFANLFRRSRISLGF